MDHSKIKWIFFDMGHTLLDEDGVHISRLEALTEELAAEGKTLPPVEEMLTEMIDFGTKGARSPFGERAKKYEILIVPSDDFGCNGYARLAYCVTREQIERALPAFEKLANSYKD